MCHRKIRIPKDTAVEVMEEIGNLDDAVQFEDLNKEDYEQRKNFSSLIQRCDEADKRIMRFIKVCENYNQELVKYNSYRTFKIDLENDKESIDKDKRFGSTYFDLIENILIEDEKKLIELIESYSSITDDLDLLIEKKSVFDKASQLLSGNQSGFEEKTSFGVNNFDITSNLIGTSDALLNNSEQKILTNFPGFSSSGLSFVSGVINAIDANRMKRMIFRVSRGRAITTFFDLVIENKRMNIKQEKKIFTIFYQSGFSETEDYILHKILSICDLFGASKFTIPNKEEISSKINELQHEIYDKKNFLKTSETTILNFIKNKIGGDGLPAKYEMYRLYFLQQKLIFMNLNKCKMVGNFIDGEVWIPAEKVNMVEEAVLKISQNDPNKLTAIFTKFANEDPNDVDGIFTNSKPPTYFKLNDFTFPFQLIVSEYGMPRYREANPGIFTIITFPFMFGVMFGDIGHGLLLSIFGGYLVYNYEELMRTHPDLKSLLKARYLLFFLGLFAFFNGWMYNDFLSMPLGIFGSCYKNVLDEKGEKIGEREKDCVYPIGMDPKWYVSTNELAFVNSLKMKTSVILGIIQMILGIILKGMNDLYFKNYINIIFEFIPQIIFMVFLFGYMIAMIFIKWGTDWSNDTSKAPSIISQLLMIFLNLGSVGPEENKTPLIYKDDYRIQEQFQYYLLIISAICVPVMWFPKPIIEIMNRPKPQIQQEGKPPVKEEGFTDLFVHQTIETIEFVLGAVSNTASYLRLWALSLAHAQLSKVFFQMTLLNFIQSGSVTGMVVGFFFLAHITLGVLMGMDLMECFLHTLRLHWVEFQNKFFKADGYAFQPFCFKYINDEFL